MLRTLLTPTRRERMRQGLIVAIAFTVAIAFCRADAGLQEAVAFVDGSAATTAATAAVVQIPYPLKGESPLCGTCGAPTGPAALTSISAQFTTATPVRLDDLAGSARYALIATAPRSVSPSPLSPPPQVR